MKWFCMILYTCTCIGQGLYMSSYISPKPPDGRHQEWTLTRTMYVLGMIRCQCRFINCNNWWLWGWGQAEYLGLSVLLLNFAEPQSALTKVFKKWKGRKKRKRTWKRMKSENHREKIGEEERKEWGRCQWLTSCEGIVATFCHLCDLSVLKAIFVDSRKIPPGK